MGGSGLCTPVAEFEREAEHDAAGPDVEVFDVVGVAVRGEERAEPLLLKSGSGSRSGSGPGAGFGVRVRSQSQGEDVGSQSQGEDEGPGWGWGEGEGVGQRDRRKGG